MRRFVTRLVGILVLLAVPACMLPGLRREEPARVRTGRVEHVAPATQSVAIAASVEQPAPEAVEAAPARFDVAMAAQETRYQRTGRMRGRAHNVELAASRLDLAVVPAHGVLSFNETVGARGRDDGYRLAPVIQNGGLVDGIGGGVCQVAGTLHAAALHAGLDTAEHRVHSRPSTYLGLGLDAAVAWPDVDLKIQNPYDFPILVRATAERGKLRVELFGATAAPAVEISIEDEVIAPFEMRVGDPTLAVGTTVVADEGREGHLVRRTRTIDGRTETRTFRYAPAARVIRVGVVATEPAFDLSAAATTAVAPGA